MHYIQPTDRNQYIMMSRLDDLIEEQHYVRLIDVFVEWIFKTEPNLFTCSGNKHLGRKAYHPASLLGLYIYSYLNGISSSRKIEKECKRNIELIWLMNYLVPDHKTISDFRKNNTESIRQVFLKLVTLLKESGYIKGQTISIDGTRIRANAAICVNLDSVSKRLENLEDQLNKYLHQIEVADTIDQEIENSEKEKQQLHQEIQQIKKNIEALEKQKTFLEEQGIKRMSPTDPESRVMKSRQGKHFCFNVQVAVDAENKLLTTTDVVSQENDKGLLLPVIEKLEHELGQTPEEILADAGYYVISQIEKIETEKKVECYVAINYNQGEAKRQIYGIDFEYDENEDLYRCTGNGILEPKYGIKKDNRRGTEAQAYVGINCSHCKLKSQCTDSIARTVYRFKNQEWKDNYIHKMENEEGKAKLKQRRSLSEHPFGTIKYWMGHIPLKTRGKKKVEAEFNLFATCYNLKRMFNIKSFDDLQKLFKSNEKLAV